MSSRCSISGCVCTPDGFIIIPDVLELTNTLPGMREENGAVLGFVRRPCPQGALARGLDASPPAHRVSVKRAFQLSYLLERADFPAVRLDPGK